MASLAVRPLGSTESPQWRPRSREKLTPVRLPLYFESFWLVTTLRGSVGLTATHSSDWKRKPQSTLARTLSGRPRALNTLGQPTVPTLGAVATPEAVLADVARRGLSSSVIALV